MLAVSCRQRHGVFFPVCVRRLVMGIRPVPFFNFCPWMAANIGGLFLLLDALCFVLLVFFYCVSHFLLVISQTLQYGGVRRSVYCARIS